MVKRSITVWLEETDIKELWERAQLEGWQPHAMLRMMILSYNVEWVYNDSLRRNEHNPKLTIPK